MKNFWKGVLTAVALGAAASLPVQATGAETACGTDKKIDIAEMDWASASALAHIHAKILADGFGCEVEVVPGNTVPTAASMIGRGQPAVAPELWMSSIEDAWGEGEAEGTVKDLGQAITDGTIEGIFIPTAVAKANNIVTIDDAVAQPALFADPEDPSKGRIYGGPPGWAAELSVSSMFEAYEMEDKGWNLFSTGSAALAASVQRAFLRDEPIMFYYWGPTAILGSVDATKLEMPAVDMEIYTCNTDSDCTESGKTDWPSSRVIVGAASWVAEEAPAVAEYFGKVGMPNEEISALLVYGLENQAGGIETAENFLKTREEVWTKWVPADVADKVRASL